MKKILKLAALIICTFLLPANTSASTVNSNLNDNPVKKVVNVVLTDNTNPNIEESKRYVYEFVLDELDGNVTVDAIANKLKAKYPVIKSLGENATLTDGETSYSYTNSVTLQFLIANNRGDDGITWYNIFYPVNINDQPNYLSASSSESTHVEKINDATYAYGDNPTYNKEIGNDPISWAIYSVDHTLTFALKNKVAGKFIQVTSIADDNAQNAVFTDEANATAFAISIKTINPVDYYAFAAEIDGKTGYLCSTDNNYGWATHYNSNSEPGAWARVEDPAYYTKYVELLWGLWLWFREEDGLCTVTDDIQAIIDALNNYEIIKLNTLKAYGLTLEDANLHWPTIKLNINGRGTTNINNEIGMTCRRAPAGYQFPVEAIPAEGYHFLKWTDVNSNTLSTDAKYITSISGTKESDITTITANFEINIYTIRATASEGGSAIIGAGDATEAAVEHGDEVRLIATANDGYEFINWTKDGVVVSTDVNYTFIAKADGEYTANFVENKKAAVGKYYRIGYDFDANDNRYYMQSVVSNISNRANALLMTQETGATSIFYYADNKLLSYKEGTYLKEEGAARGLQNVGTSGEVTITTGQATGKSTIVAPSYLHAAKSGTTYYVDHCGSDPDDHVAAHRFMLEEVTTLPVTIGTALHATLYAPVALAIPEGVKAYVLKAVDIPGIETYAWMTSLKNGIIPANTGVILKGEEAKTYYFDITENSAEAIAETDDNKLNGTVAKTHITEDAYILANRNGKIGLYPAAKNSYLDNKTDVTTVRFTNNSHKAYLPVTNDWFGDELKKSNGFNFVFDDGGTTEIKEFKAEENEIVYDLHGRRLNKITQPGIYIINGNKIWIK